MCIRDRQCTDLKKEFQWCSRTRWDTRWDTSPHPLTALLGQLTWRILMKIVSSYRTMTDILLVIDTTRYVKKTTYSKRRYDIYDTGNIDIRDISRYFLFIDRPISSFRCRLEYYTLICNIMQMNNSWPIDTDGGEVEDGCRAAHDVTRNPRVA